MRAEEKDLSLVYEWSSRMPESIESDPSRLRQLLFNLVNNAIKFTERGKIRVLAGLDESSLPPRFRIDVCDSGIGIPPEKVEGIFDPFTQADSSVTRRFGGTGLGLAICRKIAIRHGGDLSATSELGSSSTFVATMPAVQPRSERPEARPQS